jgi:hypothetical protein
MKSLFVLPLAAAGLLLAAGVANAQAIHADLQPAGRAMLEQNADESAQDITDMPYSEMGQPAKTPSRSITRASYGGTADFEGEAGGPSAARCASGSQCSIFRGR